MNYVWPGNAKKCSGINQCEAMEIQKLRHSFKETRI